MANYATITEAYAAGVLDNDTVSQVDGNILTYKAYTKEWIKSGIYSNSYDRIYKLSSGKNLIIETDAASPVQLMVISESGATINVPLTAVGGEHTTHGEFDFQIGSFATSAGDRTISLVQTSTPTLTASNLTFTAGSNVISGFANGTVAFVAGQFIQVLGTIDNDEVFKVLSTTASPDTITVDGTYNAINSTETVVAAVTINKVIFNQIKNNSSGDFLLYNNITSPSGTSVNNYSFANNGIFTINATSTFDTTYRLDSTVCTSTLFRYSTDASSPSLYLVKGRGTRGTPVAVTTSDELGSFHIQGFYDSAHAVDAFSISTLASEAWSGTAHGSSISFNSCLNTTTTLVPCFTIKNTLMELDTSTYYLTQNDLGSLTTGAKTLGNGSPAIDFSKSNCHTVTLAQGTAMTINGIVGANASFINLPTAGIGTIVLKVLHPTTSGADATVIFNSNDTYKFLHLGQDGSGNKTYTIKNSQPAVNQRYTIFSIYFSTSTNNFFVTSAPFTSA